MNFGIIPASAAPYLLSLLRFVTGVLILDHGTGKIFNFPPIHDKMLGMMGGGMLYFTGLMELIGGVLIAVGFLTRPVAFVLSGFMAAAYFLAHAPQGFFPVMNGGELAIEYCFVLLYFAAVGAGPISVDRR
jgi:putative oxidoreductase